MINILNLPKALSTSEQVVLSANANNYSLAKYIGIDENGKITNENKTVSNPVTAVENQALTNSQANPSTVLVLDSTNKIGIKTGINLNYISGVFPHCDVVNASGTSYSVGTTSVATLISGPTQSGVLQDFAAYANGIIGYSLTDSTKYFVCLTISANAASADNFTFTIYKNTSPTNISTICRFTTQVSITLTGIITLTQNDQLRLYVNSSGYSITMTINTLRWTVHKI